MRVFPKLDGGGGITWSPKYQVPGSGKGIIFLPVPDSESGSPLSEDTWRRADGAHSSLSWFTWKRYKYAPGSPES